MKEEGEDILEHLKKKYGAAGVKNFGNPDSHLYRAGRAVGIQFTSKRNAYPTIKAHSLMERLKERDNKVANQVMEEMYVRYFEGGENINSPEVLAEVAAKFGVSQDEARMAIHDADLHQQVRNKDREYKTRMGVSGVPFYILYPNKGGRPIGFSGAQPPEIIAEQLEMAADEE